MTLIKVLKAKACIVKRNSRIVQNWNIDVCTKSYNVTWYNTMQIWNNDQYTNRSSISSFKAFWKQKTSKRECGI